jgi:hypothetical protein
MPRCDIAQPSRGCSPVKPLDARPDCRLHGWRGTNNGGMNRISTTEGVPDSRPRTPASCPAPLGRATSASASSRSSRSTRSDRPVPAVPLNQIHEECGSRIRYKKTCPIHGEVSNDEIVSGYQFAKGQYVVIDPDELDQLRSERDKSIAVDRFIPAGAVDPIYHSGRTYYLVPDGPIGQKPSSCGRR